jgi:hypothetical protein
MKPIISSLSSILLVLVAAAITTKPAAYAAPVQFKVLHSFSGPDGGSLNSLFQTADGFLRSAANGGDVTSCLRWLWTFVQERHRWQRHHSPRFPRD